MCDQQAKREHGDQEFHAGTFLGDDKQPRGGVDMDALRNHLDPAQPRQRTRDLGSNHLQLRDDLAPDGDHQKAVDERKGEDQGRPQSEQREDRALHGDHRAALPDRVDVEAPPHQPENKPEDEPPQPRPPSGCAGARQFVAADPDQPGDDRGDKQDMAIGVDIPPLMRHRAPFGEGQREQRRPRDGEHHTPSATPSGAR